ncbi:MAG TPA: thioredoxin family protein [Chitinophagaceae bacterium]
MKKIFSASLPVFALSWFVLRLLIDPLPIGSVLPETDKKLKDISGKEVSFKDEMNKKGLLVMFTCNTCPIVRAYQSRTVEVCQYAASKEIGVILLNSNEGSRDDGDSYADMKDYAKNQRYKWPYVIDNNSEMANSFGASRTPECFLFNADGKLVYRGAIDNNANGPEAVTRKHLVIAMDEMIAGKVVSVNTTRSVGCTIRRPG